MSKIDLNALRDRAYKTACEHGFHDQELSNEHCLCLVISELMEAVEADRKGKRANVDWYNKKIANSRICQGLDPDIPKERGYEVAYNETIKGSIEEELADAVIRLLDLAGLRNLNLNRFALVNVVSKKKTFTENIYSIVKDITNYKYTLEELVNYAITQVFVLSDILDIDLLWHIEQKMKYNELREKMHGKKYYPQKAERIVNGNNKTNEKRRRVD